MGNHFKLLKTKVTQCHLARFLHCCYRTLKKKKTEKNTLITSEGTFNIKIKANKTFNYNLIACSLILSNLHPNLIVFVSEKHQSALTVVRLHTDTMARPLSVST